ncbi:hypothetical protein MKW92_029232, partial [Papaver armeniacum]
MCIYLQLKFDVDQTKRKDVLDIFRTCGEDGGNESAAKYVTPFEKAEKAQECSFELRGFVEQGEWKEFVKRRLSEKGK